MRKFLVLGIIICLLFSCKKNNITFHNYDPQKYFPISVGNYWVYQSSYTTDDGTKVTIGSDSLVVKKDTVIGGNNYFLVEGTWLGHRPYKEYLSYKNSQVINHKGKVWFEGSEFGSVLNPYSALDGKDTTYSEKFYMITPGSSIAVPAGTYETIALVGISRTPSAAEPTNVKTSWHYAKDIGLVKVLSEYTHDEYFIEMDLIDYKLE